MPKSLSNMSKLITGSRPGEQERKQIRPNPERNEACLEIVSLKGLVPKPDQAVSIEEMNNTVKRRAGRSCSQ